MKVIYNGAYKLKRAVITGPTGAIGTALIQCLSDNGVQVVAVVRPGSKRAGRIQESDNVKVVYCDLKELNRLPELIPEGADTFYHFGWDGTFGNSRNNMYGQNENVRYALDAVEAAKALGCSTFVGAGSQAEYGRFEGKLNAGVPAFPENGYGIAKLCAGQMTRIACREKGIKHIWVRILSVYGPYDGENTMVSSTIIKLLTKEKPSCTKGEQMWDYLYSKDAAKALLALSEKGRDGQVYCLGSGQPRPLKEYIAVIRDTVDKSLPVGFGEVPYSDRQVMYLCADIEDLVRDTGFQPSYTFEQGIAETVSWWKNQLTKGQVE